MKNGVESTNQLNGTYRYAKTGNAFMVDIVRWGEGVQTTNPVTGVHACKHIVAYDK